MKKRLTLEDRLKIEKGLKEGLFYKNIALRENIPRSTVQSEIHRYRKVFPFDRCYDAKKAHQSSGKHRPIFFGVANKNPQQLDLISECVSNTKCTIELDPKSSPEKTSDLEQRICALEAQIQILFNTIKELKSG